ncbi:MAG TPA: hypothetical protein DCW68_00145 [Rhodospirillaceae bacterium]|nr:MAG: hypothetical protein A2018_01460 [Alphaproteobacteria bacterium GWF2_58_20]HAU28510.1 hypothetical protein [Rhodospirillaceae bacterium]
MTFMPLDRNEPPTLADLRKVMESTAVRAENYADVLDKMRAFNVVARPGMHMDFDAAAKAKHVLQAHAARKLTV